MRRSDRQRHHVNGFVAVLACLMVLGALFSERVRMLAFVVAVLSVVTLLAYAADKSAARKGTWRTPEKTLHILALAGGWPGALLGQQWFRHKTQKTSFLLVFRLTVVINAALCVYFLTPQGSDRLADLLASF